MSERQATITAGAWIMNNAFTVITVLGLVASIGAAGYELSDHEKRITVNAAAVSEHEKRLATLENERQEVHEVHEILIRQFGKAP